jgi:septal ring-binding cell division protein DamX
MASRGKRGGGERVLESRHVIGLFLLMLVFSGVFFTLGYVMGRNQYDGQVRASSNPHIAAGTSVAAKPDAQPKHGASAASPTAPSDGGAAAGSEWEFYNAGKPRETEERLKPVAPAAASSERVVAASAKTNSASSAAPGAARVSKGSSKAGNEPLMPGGSYSLQVAALTKEADALDLANRLQKKKFPAFVVAPQNDKYYRVQVGPYGDQKSADAGKKGLEGAGFKAIMKH